MISFICIILQKIRNSIQPNIYECKICGEHYCEHDLSEMQNVQEMLALYPQQAQPNIISQTPLKI